MFLAAAQSNSKNKTGKILDFKKVILIHLYLFNYLDVCSRANRKKWENL